jgi:ubiquinone/menaquinone biosynthesis C-methylase UbiE
MDKKQGYFDSLGDTWDHNVTAEDMERLTHIIDRIDIRPGATVCDLGCGTGVLFDLLRRRVGETGYVVGVDFAPRAAHRAARNFPFDNIRVVEADARYLPFRDGVFDLVISYAAFAHFSPKDDMLRQAHGVLKPLGRLVIIHLMGRTKLAEMHHRAGDAVANDDLPNRQELTDMLNRARFSHCEVTDMTNLYLAIGIKP